jgi:hypothetical protein
MRLTAGDPGSMVTPVGNATSAPGTGHEASARQSAVRRRPTHRSGSGVRGDRRSRRGPAPAAAAFGPPSEPVPPVGPEERAGESRSVTRGQPRFRPTGPAPARDAGRPVRSSLRGDGHRCHPPDRPATRGRRARLGRGGVDRDADRGSPRNDLMCHRSLSRINGPFGPTHSSALTGRADAWGGTRVAVTPRGTRTWATERSFASCWP